MAVQGPVHRAQTMNHRTCVRTASTIRCRYKIVMHAKKPGDASAAPLKLQQVSNLPGTTFRSLEPVVVQTGACEHATVFCGHDMLDARTVFLIVLDVRFVIAFAKICAPKCSRYLFSFCSACKLMSTPYTLMGKQTKLFFLLAHKVQRRIHLC
jgi:hypothetical protein